MEKMFNMDNVTRFWANIQIQLYEAFLNRDIIEFRTALKNGANPFTKNTDNDVCVFYKALQTPECSEFVKESLKCSYRPSNLTNFYFEAINLACGSEDPDMLKALLESSDMSCNRKYFDLFVYSSLVRKLNNENYGIIQSYIFAAILHSLSPNIPDKEDKIPLHVIIENNELSDEIKRKIIPMFFYRDTHIDIDTFRQGELRKLLQLKYPNVKLPKQITSYQSLLNRLKSGMNLELFVEEYADNLHNISEKEKLLLLMQAIRLKAHKAFDVILSSDVNYNYIPMFNSDTRPTPKKFNLQTELMYKLNTVFYRPLELSCHIGNAYALENLLKMPDIKIEPDLLQQFVLFIITRVKSSITFYQNYCHCLQILLNSDKIDINATDPRHRTALHYAIEFRKDNLIKMLLENCAHINVGNNEHELPLNCLLPSVLEQHLDDCVTADEFKMGERDCIIRISFKNFLTTQQKNENKLKEVLAPIAFIAESKDHRYLIKHPVISSILLLKWQKVFPIFFVNFFITFFFICSFIALVILKFCASDHIIAIRITLSFSWLGIVYWTFRECIQFILSPLSHLKRPANYLEIFLIIFSILTCSYDNRDIDVACILLLSYELFSLVGSLPFASISTHMLMLETVCKSFAKSFLFYSMFIFTFTLCFYIKSNQVSEHEDQNKTENVTVMDPRNTTEQETQKHESENANDIDNEAEFNRFSNPKKAFFKTIVMFIGELDASNLNLDSTYSWLLFLSFILFITIILFNLLNGLAVSDTQEIRNLAELNGVICRIKSLMTFENVILKRSNHLTLFPNSLISKFFSNIIPDYTTDVEVCFLPNDKNKIVRCKNNCSNNSNKLVGHKNDRIYVFETNDSTGTILKQYFSPNVVKANMITTVADDIELNPLCNDTNTSIVIDLEDSERNEVKTWFSRLVSNKCSTIDEHISDEAFAILKKKYAKLPSHSTREKLDLVLQKLSFEN